MKRGTGLLGTVVKGKGGVLVVELPWDDGGEVVGVTRGPWAAVDGGP